MADRAGGCLRGCRSGVKKSTDDVKGSPTVPPRPSRPGGAWGPHMQALFGWERLTAWASRKGDRAPETRPGLCAPRVRPSSPGAVCALLRSGPRVRARAPAAPGREGFRVAPAWVFASPCARTSPPRPGPLGSSGGCTGGVFSEGVRHAVVSQRRWCRTPEQAGPRRRAPGRRGDPGSASQEGAARPPPRPELSAGLGTGGLRLCCRSRGERWASLGLQMAVLR